jgi:hypothetical protein
VCKCDGIHIYEVIQYATTYSCRSSSICLTSLTADQAVTRDHGIQQIQPGTVYNMYETGIVLGILNSRSSPPTFCRAKLTGPCHFDRHATAPPIVQASCARWPHGVDVVVGICDIGRDVGLQFPSSYDVLESESHGKRTGSSFG